jgi:hypothetical protein
MASFVPWQRSHLLPILRLAALSLWAPVGCGLLKSDAFKASDVKSRTVRRDQAPKFTISGWTSSRVRAVEIEMKGTMAGMG